MSSATSARARCRAASCCGSRRAGPGGAARLGPETTAVARAVAVLGEHADLPAIGSLAGIDDQAVAAASAALARTEILRPARPLGFVHPLVRDAVYHDPPLGERELQHTLAAR